MVAQKRSGKAPCVRSLTRAGEEARLDDHRGAPQVLMDDQTLTQLEISRIGKQRRSGAKRPPLAITHQTAVRWYSIGSTRSDGLVLTDGGVTVQALVKLTKGV